MEKDSQDSNDKRPRKGPRFTRKKLDNFLASICEAAGMNQKPGSPQAKRPRLACRANCGRADWRAHLDVPYGILCVSAAWSANKKAEKHRDVTIGVTYLDESGKPDYADMTFCDSEVRWIMEALWHAPIWE